MSVSLPAPPLIVPVPVQSLRVKLFAEFPPVRFAISILVITKLAPPEATSELLLSVKFALLLDMTVSLLFPPSNVPVPVQPLTVKVFAPTPPVRLADSMLVSVNEVPVDLFNDPLLSVKSASLLDVIASVPPCPSRTSAPVQSLTANVLSPSSPVRNADSIPASDHVPPLDTVS